MYNYHTLISIKRASENSYADHVFENKQDDAREFIKMLAVETAANGITEDVDIICETHVTNDAYPIIANNAMSRAAGNRSYESTIYIYTDGTIEGDGNLFKLFKKMYDAALVKDSNKIAYYRLLKDMTQSGLAAKLGTTERTVQKWELGERKPSTKYVAKLSDILGIDIKELL